MYWFTVSLVDSNNQCKYLGDIRPAFAILVGDRDESRILAIMYCLVWYNCVTRNGFGPSAFSMFKAFTSKPIVASISA